jgi:hypothetical protein
MSPLSVRLYGTAADYTETALPCIDEVQWSQYLPAGDEVSEVANGPTLCTWGSNGGGRQRTEYHK